MSAKRDAQAHPGDVVVVHGHTTGDPGRTGVILDVLDCASAHEHHRVRWDEEHVSLFWPGSDATCAPEAAEGEARCPPRLLSRRGRGNDAVPDNEC